MATLDGVSAGPALGGTLVIAYAVLIAIVNGRTRPGRPPYAVLAARLRAATWLSIGIAVLAAGAGSAVLAGLLAIVALALAILAAVVGLRGKRQAVRDAGMK